MNNVAKNFLAIIILIIQQNYFSDLYPAKILDFLAKNHSFHYCITVNC